MAIGQEVLAVSNQQESSKVEERWKEFRHDHQTFDSSWARHILHNLSEFLPYVFEFDAVPVGLKQLYVKSGVKFPRDFEWEDAWPEASELPASYLSVLPIFKLALALRAYAYYGLILEILPRWQGLWDFLGEKEIFSLWGYDKDAEQTIIAAEARYKLDHPKEKDSEALTPEELAALARVSRKSIMNLIAGKSGVLQKAQNDRITIESARRWLLARSDFRPSVWQQQGSVSLSPQGPDSSVVEPLFVPVSRDGGWFSPSDRHQRDGHYYVGNGDDEKKFDDYWTALDFLARAASPRWRYADTTGRWRIETAVGWERKTRQEVESQLPHDEKNQRRSKA
jgi:hypothetical protein